MTSINNILQKLIHRFRSNPPQVFIVCGGRRTGTTLMSAILSSDERANPLGQESQILTRIIESYRWGSVNFVDFGPSFFPDYQSYKIFFQKIMTQFSNEASARMSPGRVLILKNPELSKVLLSAVELFPTARFIVILRDPRDQVAAELQTGLKRIKMGIQDTPCETRNMTALANVYKSYYKEILELHKQRHERLLVVRYEDLVQDSHEILLRLKKFTGLKLTFDPDKQWSRVSEFAGLDTPRPSHSDLYGQPISSRSVGRYKNDLSTEEISTIEEICRDLIDELGY